MYDLRCNLTECSEIDATLLIGVGRVALVTSES